MCGNHSDVENPQRFSHIHNSYYIMMMLYHDDDDDDDNRDSQRLKGLSKLVVKNNFEP